MAHELAEKQRTFLLFLRDFIRAHGRWPKYREMMEPMGWRSVTTVAAYLRNLHKAGYLGRDSSGYYLDTNFAELERGLPVLGVITAGKMREAVEVELDVLTLRSILPDIKDIFALRVSGDSMIDEGIEDGDHVLLKEGELQSGEIGAVLYNGETTLKRIFFERDGLRLELANPDYHAVSIRPAEFEEVRILGRYVGHVGKNGVWLAK